MFEHIQQRNRRPIIIPIVAGVVACAAVYVMVARSSRAQSDREANALFAAGALAWDDDHLARVELEGMSIELPGTPIRNGRYEEGTAQSGRVAIGWSPGKLIRDPALITKQFELLGGGTKVDETTFGGTFAYEEHVGLHLHIVAGSCGRRAIFLQVNANRVTFDRIKASFECTPAHALEHLGVIVGPHQNWHRTDDDPKIHLSDATGDAAMTLQSRREMRTPSPELGIPSDAKPEVRGSYRIWRWRRNDFDGRPRLMGLVEWPCKDQPYSGEALIAGAGSIDEAIALALTGSCIAMSDRLPSYLSVADTRSN